MATSTGEIDFEPDRVHEGWRADIGIPELALVIRNVRRPRNPQRLAVDFMRLGWGTEHAVELAAIASRLSELAYTPRRELVRG